MPMRSPSKRYINLHDDPQMEPWYWRLIALAASWMILAGYVTILQLKALGTAKSKANNPRPAVISYSLACTPKIPSSDSAPPCCPSLSSPCSPPDTPSPRCFALPAAMSASKQNPSSCTTCPTTALTIILLTTPYSPALASSALGLLTIAYNFLASRSYEWGTAAISGTVISATSTLLYGALLLWTHRRMIKSQEKSAPRPNMWSEQTYYTNYISNMYPTSSRSPSAPPELPLTEDDGINQQMAMLLMKSDSGTSPDASSATFRIDLPEDREERERIANSQELRGSPPAAAHPVYREQPNGRSSRPDSLSEQQAWARWQDRGRTTDRPPSVSGRSHHSRNVSREERRREIELGLHS